MNKYLISCISVFIIGYFTAVAYPSAGTGYPLKYISSCEIDINNDNEADIALLVETSRGNELIILIKTANGYSTYVVSKDKPNMYLSCHFGETVTESSAGKGEKTKKVYKTPGTYIKLTQPEGSSVVYFWTDKGFKEIWTSD